MSGKLERSSCTFGVAHLALFLHLRQSACQTNATLGSLPASWGEAKVRRTSNVAEFVLGIYGPITSKASSHLATAVAFDLDFRKNFEPALRERFGPPVISIPNLNPNLRIKVQIGTSDSNSEIGVDTSLDFFLGSNGMSKISGLVGGRYSSISMTVASLAAVYKIPQISFASTSPKLSNKDMYPYFSRTIPPDSIQGAGMWQFIVHFQVPAVTFLYSMESYGEGLYSTVASLAVSAKRSYQVTGVQVEYMPGEFDPTKAEQRLNETREIGNKVIFLAFPSNQAFHMACVMDKEGMLNGSWQILGSEALYAAQSGNDDVCQLSYPVGLIAFNPISQGYLFEERFKDMWQKMTANDVHGSDARTLYSLDKLKVPLEEGKLPLLTDDMFASVSNLGLHDPFLFDAAYTFAIAVNSLLNANETLVTIAGKKLLAQVKDTSFEGISGRVKFDSKGDRLASYTIDNVQPESINRTAKIVKSVAEFDAAAQHITRVSGTDFFWMHGLPSETLPETFIACEEGHFLEPIRRLCRPCESGSISLGGMQSECTRCAVGKAEKNKVDCENCQPGRYSSRVGSSHCDPCPEGKYNPLPGMRRCENCPVGGDCKANSTHGAEVFEALPGYYILDAFDIARHISERANDFNGLPVTSNGGIDGIGPLRCPVASACLGRNMCKKTVGGKQIMEGPLCGSCSRGTQRKTPLEVCSECPSAVQNGFLLVLVVIGFLLVSLAFDYWSVLAAGSLLSLTSMVLKVMLNFFVLLAAIADNIRFDDLVTRLPGLSGVASPVLAALSLGRGFENPSKAVFSTSCMAQDISKSISVDFVLVLAAWLTIPVMLVMQFFCILAVRALERAWRHRYQSSSKEQYSTTGEASMNTPHEEVQAEESLETRFLSTSIVLLYFLHTMVTARMLLLFQCGFYDEETMLEYDAPRLRIDLSIRCDSSEAAQWQLVAGLGFMFWSLGVPLFFMLMLRYVRRSGPHVLMANWAKRKYGFLTDGYELDVYYYESIVMLRKVLFLLAGCFPWQFTNESRTFVLLAITFLFHTLHLRLEPFDNRAYFGLDALEASSLATVNFFLWGRLFEGVLSRSKFGFVKELTTIGYLPAIFSFFWFMSWGIFLLARSTIWPLNRKSCILTVLPGFIRKDLDVRVTWTLNPPEDNDAQDHEHVRVGFGTGPHKLPHREMAILKGFFVEVVEVLLTRHILVQGSTPSAISLQMFMLQMERLCTGCMCEALKKRVKAISDQKSSLPIKERMQRVVQRERSISLTDDIFTPRSETRLHAIAQPVSMEELQLALMSLLPRLLDPELNTLGRNFLAEFTWRHRGLLDSCTSVTPLFKPLLNLTRTRSICPSQVSDSGPCTEDGVGIDPALDMMSAGPPQAVAERAVTAPAADDEHTVDVENHTQLPRQAHVGELRGVLLGVATLVSPRAPTGATRDFNVVSPRSDHSCLTPREALTPPVSPQEALMRQ